MVWFTLPNLENLMCAHLEESCLHTFSLIRNSCSGPRAALCLAPQINTLFAPQSIFVDFTKMSGCLDEHYKSVQLASVRGLLWLSSRLTEPLGSA